MATYGLWQSANGAGRIADCCRLSARLQQLTTEDADDELRLEAHHSAWATCLFSGEPAAARDHCEAGHRLYDPERHRLLHERYGGHDPGLCADYFGAQANWLLGYPDQSLALGSRALTMAKRIAHPFSFALALQYNAIVHLDRGEPALALERLASAEALAAEQRLSFVVEPQLLRGAILAAQGEFGEAIVYLRQGLGGAGAARVQCYGFAWLARTFISLGDHRAAGAAAAEGLETANRTGHRQWEAELHRLHGLALCGLNDLDNGQLGLQAAIAMARRQQAKSYELRAGMSLARLWGETGRRTEATELLAPIFGWFTEGFDTLDLKEAAALLNALA